MVRVKGGIATHRRHRKMVKAAKGYRQLGSRIFKQAKNKVAKAGQNSYAHRRLKKRSFRSLWIVRLNAACRANNTKYSEFINGLLKNNIQINRKTLSELAQVAPESFEAILDIAKK